jgi:hypothetical protein
MEFTIGTYSKEGRVAVTFNPDSNESEENSGPKVGPSVLKSRTVPFASFCDTDGFYYRANGATKDPATINLCPRNHLCDGCNAYRAIYEGSLILDYQPPEDRKQVFTRANV